jgi:hypothetical protein
LGDVGIGRFDAASHLAPEVDFPRSVETALVERVGFPQQLGESVAVGPADLVEQARAGAEFTLALPLDRRGRIDLRQALRGGHVALDPCLREMERGGAQVGAGGKGAPFEFVENGIAEPLPPVGRQRGGIGKRRAQGVRPAVPAGPVGRRDGGGLVVIRSDRTAAKAQRRRHGENRGFAGERARNLHQRHVPIRRDGCGKAMRQAAATLP